MVIMKQAITASIGREQEAMETTTITTVAAAEEMNLIEGVCQFH